MTLFKFPLRQSHPPFLTPSNPEGFLISMKTLQKLSQDIKRTLR